MDWIEQFLEESKTSFTNTSLVTYKNELMHFARWFEDNAQREFSPGELVPVDLKQYREFLKQSKQATTINKGMAALRAFCSWAVSKGLMDENIGQGISFLPVFRGAPKWLDRKEQYRLVRAAQQDSIRNYALAMIMLHGGLRVQEVSDLQLGDVAISERKGYAWIRYSKQEKSRKVPLNKDLREALNDYLEERKKREVTSKWLFISQRSGKMSPRAIQYVISEIGHNAKIVDLSCHRLRHTFGKNLVDQDVPLDRVAMLMGHFTKSGQPNVRSTVIYTQPGEADLEAAVERIAWN